MSSSSYSSAFDRRNAFRNAHRELASVPTPLGREVRSPTVEESTARISELEASNRLLMAANDKLRAGCRAGFAREKYLESKLASHGISFKPSYQTMCKRQRTDAGDAGLPPSRRRGGVPYVHWAVT